MKKVRGFVFVIVCLCVSSVLFAMPNSSLKAFAASPPQEQIQIVQKQEIRLPIIMYHGVCNKNPGTYRVPTSQFEEDIIYIKKCGYTTVTFSDILDFVDNGTPLPEKPIMLTFDDGMLDNYMYAFPILKRQNVKAVFSVVGKYIDNNYDGEKSTPTFANFNYEHICEMVLSGLVEIQNHTYDMHNGSIKKGRIGVRQLKSETPEQYEKALSEDLTKLNDILFKRCGIKCTTVAFPFGAYSKQTIEIVKKLGFRAALTCREGINTITRTSNLYNLKRYNRPAGVSTKAYFDKKLEN